MKPWAYILTLSRPVLAAGFAACAYRACIGAPAAGGPIALPWLAALLMLAGGAELTDLFDGMVARRCGVASRLGGLLDPLCDSLARLTMYFALALAGWITLAVPLVMVGRDIIVAYVRIVQAYSAGQTSAHASGKLKAIVQGVAIFVILLLAAWAPSATGDALRQAAAGIIIAVTVWSLVDYVGRAWGAIAAMYRNGGNQ